MLELYEVRKVGELRLCSLLSEIYSQSVSATSLWVAQDHQND